MLNELQAGSYVFMDADYRAVLNPDGNAAAFEHSLFVAATVMSAPTAERRVTEAGLKALAFDCGPPLVHGIDGVTYQGPSDEHGTLAVVEGVDLGLGDRVMLIPGHCDPTVNLYDWFVGYRDGAVRARLAGRRPRPPRLSVGSRPVIRRAAVRRTSRRGPPLVWPCGAMAFAGATPPRAPGRDRR